MPSSPGARIRVLVVDDHALLRRGVTAVLEDEPDLDVVAEASTGREAVEAFRLYRPDVTLMDLQMPEMTGTEAITEIRASFPDARIVVLTTYRGDVSALRALRAGAVGYLLKDRLRTELPETIRAVHAGRRVIPPEVAMDLAAHLGESTLSERELQVLRCVAQGGSNKRIAATLGIMEETVKTHIKSVLAKLGATDRTHAVTIALRRGILDL